MSSQCNVSIGVVAVQQRESKGPRGPKSEAVAVRCCKSRQCMNSYNCNPK